MPNENLTKRVRHTLFGNARDLRDSGLIHGISLTAFLAWIGMGADGLSSSCYGPEEAYLNLGQHTFLATAVALATVFTVIVISTSYSQIIELFPSGGGGYLVASKLLSPTFGMISGCALLIDYVLTVALSISSGADALFSFLPPEWYSFRIPFAVAGLTALVLLNLRGTRESVRPLVPIMLLFVVTHGVAILWAFSSHATRIPQIASDTVRDLHSASGELGLIGLLFLLLRAYSMGAGTYTGIEAVSNGLPVIREPRVINGKRTMRLMAISLGSLVFGLIIAYLLYNVRHVEGKTLNAVLFESITASWPHGLGVTFVTVTLVSEAVLLMIAAQTGFLDGPRVLANMALDRWFPSRFGMLSDRLVTQNGVLFMGALALTLILATGGSVKYLIVLYSITVFITFVLSQLGMVRHWWQERAATPRWKIKLTINGIGLILTSFILLSMCFTKFRDGGWLTLVVLGLLVLVASSVRRHYKSTSAQLRRLDDLLLAAAAQQKQTHPQDKPQPAIANPMAQTAILLVNGFNGLGLHSLFNVTRLFGEHFRNFVFVQVGVVDSGSFRATTEMETLNARLLADGRRYVDLVRQHGYEAESVQALGVDVVEEIDNVIPPLIRQFPHSVVFGGQLVFDREYLFSRWLHNHTIFAIQKRLYHQGIPVVILPIRVDSGPRPSLTKTSTKPGKQ